MSAQLSYIEPLEVEGEVNEQERVLDSGIKQNIDQQNPCHNNNNSPMSSFETT